MIFEAILKGLGSFFYNDILSSKCNFNLILMNSLFQQNKELNPTCFAEFPYSFYALLNGKVSIYVNTDAGMEVADKSGQTKDSNSNDNQNDKVALDRTKFGNQVAVFGVDTYSWFHSKVNI